MDITTVGDAGDARNLTGTPERRSALAAPANIAGTAGMPKTKQPPKSLTAARPLEGLIRVIRGQKVILDADLAALYEVETKQLNRAVKRNLSRFPEEFMFQLTEAERLRCQIGTSNAGRGGRRYLPYAFTEHGVVMLSSVLNSERAVQMNILIVKGSAAKLVGPLETWP
ncbi:MAG: ORF6N domain-containing protein [Bryobacteraceae bacterium]